MSSNWDHVAFREYVIGHAKRVGVADDQASLAKLTGIDSGLLGRYFRGETQPGSTNLRKIHGVVPGTKLTELMVLAGRAPASAFDVEEQPTAPRGLHPRAEQVEALLGEQSTLEDGEREILDTLLDRVLSPYQPTSRRKTG
ncbi:helix-turn-helix transcriptional regulator [Micromonospora sp. STR1s_5]|nr:helix-turn-helix transcriptional regulator [Micromonospora sp. STR1s_5]